MSDWDDYGFEVYVGDWSLDNLERHGANLPQPWANQNLTSTDHHTQDSSSSSRQQQPSHPQPPSASSPSTPTTSREWRAISSASSSAPRAGPAATHADTQQPHAPQHRRSIQPTISTRGLAPVSEFTEDWLDPFESTRNLERLPFVDYTREGIFDTSSDSDSEGDQELVQHSGAGEDMPSATRSRQRESVVDLTQEPTSPADPRHPPNASRKRDVIASGSGPASKRPKHNRDENEIEELDLTNEAPSIEEELLQNQQQEAINSQRGSDQSGPQKVGKLTCNICLENFTNATITACGHIFCHECIIQALIASERSSDSSTGRCPLCRKALSRRKQNNMIPISFMKRSAFKGRHGIPGSR